MHATHQPGTHTECPDCRELAYEPGWYASLAAFLSNDVAILHRVPVPAS